MADRLRKFGEKLKIISKSRHSIDTYPELVGKICRLDEDVSSEAIAITVAYGDRRHLVHRKDVVWIDDFSNNNEAKILLKDGK